MIKSGVCSVTFREKTAEEVVGLTAKAGLDGIEWGGDRHVPPGDMKNAERVGKLTREAGLTVASYGSYFSAVDKDGQLTDCAPAVETAAALGAPVIRIWAGASGAERTPERFRAVVEQSRRIADLAQKEGIKIGYEFHGNTFTETLDSTLKLLNTAAHPDLYTFWQPQHGTGLDEWLRQIAALKNRLLYLHVFHWEKIREYAQCPLEKGKAFWPACFQAANGPDAERYALIEFVRENNPEQFLRDAATLKKWLLF